MTDKRCLTCSWYDPEFDCTCPCSDMWYCCPLNPEPEKLEEFIRYYENR